MAYAWIKASSSAPVCLRRICALKLSRRGHHFRFVPSLGSGQAAHIYPILFPILGEAPWTDLRCRWRSFSVAKPCVLVHPGSRQRKGLEC